MRNLLSVIILCLFIFCQSDKERTLEEQNSFCYWKTTLSFSDIELFKQTSANHLYVRYFDVGWDANAKEPKPIETLQVYFHSFPCKLITPCVFFKNRVFQVCSKEQLDTLARRVKNRIIQVDMAIAGVINKYQKHLPDSTVHPYMNYSDILIDCDWTEKTKDNFFYFVQQLRKEISNKKLTTTLRLWQYKNQQMAGIPPVERVLLMCYHVQAADNHAVENSIASMDEIRKYIEGVNYPLNIDIALPIFSWGVIFRGQDFKGIIKDARLEDYIDNPHYERISENRFKLNEEVVIGDFFARPGDEIRIEMLSKDELKALADYLISHVKTDKYSRITFFSWEDSYVKNYGADEIKAIYNRIAR
jgi:hypothetical protein